MPDSEGTVTAIVATRDRPQLLRRTLRSFAAQDSSVLAEVIVVFDGSEPDATLIHEFPELNLGLVGNERTAGLPGARNTGIHLASTDWVAFCDDDDEWLPEKTGLQLRSAAPDDFFIVGGIKILNGDRSVVRIPGEGSISMARLVKSRVMEAHPSTYMIKRSALMGPLGLIDEAIPGGYYEDYDILLRAARIRPIATVNEPLAAIHWHGNSFYQNKWKMTIDAIDYLIEKTPEFASSRAGLARLYGQQAFALAGLGRRSDTLAKARETFLLDPRQLRSYLAFLVAITPVKAESMMRLANSVGRGI